MLERLSRALDQYCNDPRCHVNGWCRAWIRANLECGSCQPGAEPGQDGYRASGFFRLRQLRARLALTHEEIAEIIGVARETVARLFASFRRERLIEVHYSTLMIANKVGLEKLFSA